MHVLSILLLLLIIHTTNAGQRFFYTSDEKRLLPFILWKDLQIHTTRYSSGYEIQKEDGIYMIERDWKKGCHHTIEDLLIYYQTFLEKSTVLKTNKSTQLQAIATVRKKKFEDVIGYLRRIITNIQRKLESTGAQDMIKSSWNNVKSILPVDHS